MKQSQKFFCFIFSGIISFCSKNVFAGNFKKIDINKSGYTIKLEISEDIKEINEKIICDYVKNSLEIVYFCKKFDVNIYRILKVAVRRGDKYENCIFNVMNKYSLSDYKANKYFKLILDIINKEIFPWEQMLNVEEYNEANKIFTECINNFNLI